jgi:uncharacterized SAM-binding protein YcdF (DUF218 family)
MMDFAILSRVVAILITPGNLLLWAMLAGAILLFTRRASTGRILVLLAAVAGLAIAALPLDAWLARPLEDRFPRRTLPDRINGILILSGGPNVTVFSARGVPAPDSAEGRLVAAADLARHHPEARIIFSGGIAPVIGGAAPETIVARSLLAQMGIPSDRITLEDRARNTWENFIYSKALARPRPGDAWVVVTSALNMPRAMAIAEQQCWPVLAWPSDYISSGRPERVGPIDFAGRLSALDTVMHEWLGLAAYRLTDRAGPCVR